MSIDGGGDKSWQSYAEFKNYKLENWESNCGNFKNGKFKSKFINFDRSIPFGRYWSAPAVYNFGMVDNNGIGGYEGKLMGLYANGLSKFDKKNLIIMHHFLLLKRNNIIILRQR